MASAVRTKVIAISWYVSCSISTRILLVTWGVTSMGGHEVEHTGKLPM